MMTLPLYLNHFTAAPPALSLWQDPGVAMEWWYSIRYWYEDLEAWDKGRLGIGLAVALLLFTPWHKKLAIDAAMQPKPEGLVVLVAPGTGYVKEMPAERGKILAAGELAFSYSPQTQAAYGSAFPQYTPYSQPATNSIAAGMYQEDEQKIRDRYQRQMEDAYAAMDLYQEQVNRAYSQGDAGLYDAQLATKALARAREVPYELNRQMSQELAALHSERDSYRALNQSAQLQIAQYQRAPSDPSPSSDVPVKVDGRVCVWSTAIRGGMRIRAGQECARLFPEDGALEIRGVVPAEFIKEVHPGQAATLEMVDQAHDAVFVPIRITQTGNRDLDWDEARTFLPTAMHFIHYRLVTLEPLKLDPRLFPPPARCRVHLVGAYRCLLQRIFS